MRRVLRATMLTLAAAAACRSSTAPAVSSPALYLEEPLAPGIAVRRVARIAFYSDPAVVEVPAAAVAAVPLTVAVTTYGGGCVGEDTTVTFVEGLHADVVPYQRVITGVACTLELRITKRQIAIVFAAAGRATVRVIGRVSPSDSLVVVERGVTVR